VRTCMHTCMRTRVRLH